MRKQILPQANLYSSKILFDQVDERNQKRMAQMLKRKKALSSLSRPSKYISSNNSLSDIRTNKIPSKMIGVADLNNLVQNTKEFLESLSQEKKSTLMSSANIKSFKSPSTDEINNISKINNSSANNSFNKIDLVDKEINISDLEDNIDINTNETNKKEEPLNIANSKYSIDNNKSIDINDQDNIDIHTKCHSMNLAEANEFALKYLTSSSDSFIQLDNNLVAKAKCQKNDFTESYKEALFLNAESFIENKLKNYNVIDIIKEENELVICNTNECNKKQNEKILKTTEKEEIQNIKRSLISVKKSNNNKIHSNLINSKIDSYRTNKIKYSSNKNFINTQNKIKIDNKNNSNRNTIDSQTRKSNAKTKNINKVNNKKEEIKKNNQPIVNRKKNLVMSNTFSTITNNSSNKIKKNTDIKKSKNKTIKICKTESNFNKIKIPNKINNKDNKYGTKTFKNTKDINKDKDETKGYINKAIQYSKDIYKKNKEKELRKIKCQGDAKKLKTIDATNESNDLKKSINCYIKNQTTDNYKIKRKINDKDIINTTLHFSNNNSFYNLDAFQNKILTVKNKKRNKIDFNITGKTYLSTSYFSFSKKIAKSGSNMNKLNQSERTSFPAKNSKFIKTNKIKKLINNKSCKEFRKFDT